MYDNIFDVRNFLELINNDSNTDEERELLVSHSFDLILLSIFIKILEIIPVQAILPFSCNDSDNGRKLLFGKKTHSLICKMLSSNVLGSLLPNYSTLLISVLEVLDPKIESDIKNLYKFTNSINFFEKNYFLESYDFDHFILLSSCLDLFAV